MLLQLIYFFPLQINSKKGIIGATNTYIKVNGLKVLYVQTSSQVILGMTCRPRTMTSNKNNMG